MGFSYSNRASRLEAQAEYEAEQEKEHAALLLLANKIAMMVSSKIINDIVRPGPTPAERECYIMAQEIQDINPELASLVVDILKIEKVKL